MPILPESVFVGPPLPMTYRRRVPSPKGPEAPLFSSTKSRGQLYPLYPLPQNKAHVPPVETFQGGGPPDARIPQRKQFPQNFNTGSFLQDLAAPKAAPTGGSSVRRAPPEITDLVCAEADFLHP